ncbi:addiction module antidote protein, HigA family [Luteitalea pratensis]|uniref:Addiction module antidote protein, HigA family n=2 Tax=Luteitalea pratensis TaxID=1855912 RepID=A0A143PQ38_LUTPR|nr:addiction module antidote protein, HigA family [Luteitalea pratensis]
MVMNRGTSAPVSICQTEQNRTILPLGVAIGLQQSVVADELGISRNRLNELILGKGSVTADTAIRLDRRFKMPARFWLHLQADYDLQTALNEAKAVQRRMKRLS